MQKINNPTSKEPVKIRYRKLANGNFSLYLDIYRGGGVERERKFLKLYIVPEKTLNDKKANKNTMIIANDIKARVMLELQREENGLPSLERSNHTLFQCIHSKIETCNTKSVKEHYVQLQHSLEKFHGGDIVLKKVTPDFIERFCKYLKSYKKQNGKGYSNKTIQLRMTHLGIVIRMAYRNEIISSNPMEKTKDISIPKTNDSEREFLTVDELTKMIRHQYKKGSAAKKPFLFSCFCGLRAIDISNMKWDNVYEYGGKTWVKMVQQKTLEIINIPLSKEAMKYMPQRSPDDTGDDYVFKEFHKLQTNATPYLKAWAKSAGVNKEIVFHSARHTFAMMMINLHVDIYTVSKLLGHTSVRTTQIYLKLLNESKIEAIDMIPEFNI